jgi:hypothetical protein
MFKFNFDIEDAGDIEEPSLANKSNNLECAQESLNAFESESEPFTEHTLIQLVRLQFIFLTATMPERGDLVRFSAGQDILFSPLYTDILCSEIHRFDTTRSIRCAISAYLGQWRS